MKFFNWLLLFGIFLIPTASLAQVSPWKIAALALQIPTGGSALASFLNHSAKQKSDPIFVQQVLYQAKGLQDRGFPTRPYLLKADEGLSKGIPPGRINRALKTTQRQTFTAGRFANQAIAKGWVHDSAQVRRELTQRYQWALLNGVPPGQLNRMNHQFHASPGKAANLSRLNQDLREITYYPGSKTWHWDEDFEKVQKGKQPGWKGSEKSWKAKPGWGPGKGKYKKSNHPHQFHPHSKGKGHKKHKKHKEHKGWGKGKK